MENSQMKDGQSGHDDHYGYGLLDIDALIDSFGNTSSEGEIGIYTGPTGPWEKLLVEKSQVARRTTARVPPVSSTNASV